MKATRSLTPSRSRRGSESSGGYAGVDDGSGVNRKRRERCFPGPPESRVRGHSYAVGPARACGARRPSWTSWLDGSCPSPTPRRQGTGPPCAPVGAGELGRRPTPGIPRTHPLRGRDARSTHSALAFPSSMAPGCSFTRVAPERVLACPSHGIPLTGQRNPSNEAACHAVHHPFGPGPSCRVPPASSDLGTSAKSHEPRIEVRPNRL